MGGDSGTAGEAVEPTFDEMVERVLDRVLRPHRRGAPQLADPFVGVARHTVPTAHGAVAAWRVGKGPAVLLIHGWQDDSSLWTPLIRALLEKGRAVVAFDLLAHGFSYGDRGLTFELVDAAHAVADALGPIDALVAHSFAGGGSALAISEGLPADHLVLMPRRCGRRTQPVSTASPRSMGTRPRSPTGRAVSLAPRRPRLAPTTTCAPA